MNKHNTALRLAFDAYMREFGADGYNRDTFVDFVVANVVDPADGVDGVIDWYRKRADALEKEAEKHAPRVSTISQENDEFLQARERSLRRPGAPDA